jgi:hypothetical protein
MLDKFPSTTLLSQGPMDSRLAFFSLAMLSDAVAWKANAMAGQVENLREALQVSETLAWLHP